MDRLRGQDARTNRIVHAFEARHVDEASAVAHEQRTRQAELIGHRVVAALGDDLRAPLDALATLQNVSDQRMQFELLQQVVDAQRRVGPVEADDEADRDVVGAHRIDPRATKFAIATGAA